MACPGVTWPGVDSHILVLGVAPGVSEPGLWGVTPGVSEPFGRPGVSSHRLAEGVEIWEKNKKGINYQEPGDWKMASTWIYIFLKIYFNTSMQTLNQISTISKRQWKQEWVREVRPIGQLYTKKTVVPLTDKKDIWEVQRTSEMQGTKLTFLARSHLAPKFSKVKMLGTIKKKR